MAVIACRPLAGVLTGVDGEAVTEYGTRPARGRMTAFTGFRETSGNVIRIGHRFIHRAVTRITVCGSSGVPSANMATQTLHDGVGTRERETGSAMVEYSARPLACAVASLAICRKPGRWVIGIGGLVVFRQMTTDTASIQPGVPTVRVAGCTVHIDVSPAQREARRSVVKLGSSPARCGVAQRTILRKACRCMVGVRCAVIAIQMTGCAIGRCT